MSLVANESDPRIEIPADEQAFLYDLEVGDLVAPYGKGKVGDFEVIYASNGKKYRDFEWATLKVRFVRPYDGCYRVKKDMWSTYKSNYQANLAHISTQELSFSVVRSQRKYDWLNDEEYLILQTRSRVDQNGKFVGAHYSKLYGMFFFGFSRLETSTSGCFSFQSYFNPTFNDTNLEAIEEWTYETKAANPEIYKRITQGSKRSK